MKTRTRSTKTETDRCYLFLTLHRAGHVGVAAEEGREGYHLLEDNRGARGKEGSKAKKK